VNGAAWRGWREDDDDVHVRVVGLGDRSRWRGMTASSQQVTDRTGAGLDVSERVVVHVVASWKVAQWEVRHYYMLYPAKIGWLRWDYGILFLLTFLTFTHIRQYPYPIT
jgi:hypothetical protein